MEPFETRLSVEARLERLEEVVGFVAGCAERSGLDDSKRFGMHLAVEEAVVNICSYAYPEGGGMIDVACFESPGSFVIELSDSGIPFDMLSLPDPDTGSAIEDRAVGGLGGYFIRKFSDASSYERRSGRNVLRLVFRQGNSR